MVTSKKTLKQVIVELGEEQEKQLKDHPSTEDLLYYLERVLPEQKADELQAHIALCRSCADTLLELDEPLGFVPDPQIRFQPESPVGKETLPEPNKRKDVFWKSRFRWLSAAAALILFFAGFLLRPYLLPGQPLMNPQIETLSPEDAVSSTRGSTRIAMSSDGRPLILHLNLAQRKEYSSYRIVITDAHGKKIWESPEGRPGDGGGRFTIVLPSGFLSAGTYHVALSGMEGQRWDRMKEYTFTLVND